MPRKLKAYQTSIGFFDLAIAAPSMKAALEAWGSKANLFHQGFAQEAGDPGVVAAAMARPGVVLRRAVGSNGTFSEHAELPSDLTGGEANGTERKLARKSPVPPRRGNVDDKAAREAPIAYARDQKRRDSERRRQEAAQEAERGRREHAIAKAEIALEGRNEPTLSKAMRSQPRVPRSTDSQRPRRPDGINRRRNWKRPCGRRENSKGMSVQLLLPSADNERILPGDVLRGIQTELSRRFWRIDRLLLAPL
jgi:hypothetical protein